MPKMILLFTTLFSINVYGQFSISSWLNTAGLPTADGAVGGVGCGGHLFVLSNLHSYVGEPGTDGQVAMWRTTLPLPVTTFIPHHPICNGGYILAVAGPNSYVGRIDTDGSIAQWAPALGTVNQAATGRSVTANGTTIYSLGGGTSTGVIQTFVEMATLSPSGELSAWQTLTPLPLPLHDSQSAVINGYLYVFGGEGTGGNTTPSRDVRRALIASDGTIGAWQLVGLLQTGRPHSAYLRYGGTLHVLGGGVHSVYTNTVESVSEASLGITSQHYASASLPTILSSMGAAVVGRYGYVLGGGDTLFGTHLTNAVRFAELAPAEPRSFLISFTGFGNSPCIFSAFPGCSEYPSAPPENGRGMTTLINNVEGLPELATLSKRAFTFFTQGHGSANLPPNDESPHAEAEAWLRGQNLRAQDKLMIVGHSYGGNRARLFAAQIYGALGRRTDTLVLVDPIDWIKCGGTAFALARFTIGLLNVGPCDQQSDSFPIPVGVDNAVVYRQAVDVGFDRALAGYTLASATSLNLTHPHMEIDDAETVHREIINRLMPNLLARPAVRLRVKSTLVTAERVDGLAVGFRVTVTVENTGKLIASNVNLTQFELGGVSPIIFPKFEVILPGATASVSTLLTGLSLSPGRTVRFSMRGFHNPETNGLPFGVDLKTVYLPSAPTL